ncbi:hypothetical protein HJD18_15790 [Thermoleophilia bacterium SCSIO 60948]|nr:hypothetical protein HJD18_15790 [Thermoleophilia bacterium SCSIO 60948]
MTGSRRTEPPSGAPPPASATTADGRDVELEPLAAEICRRYYERYTDEAETYGGNGVAWCVHDNQYLLDWAIGDVSRVTDLDAQVAWLSGILSRRGFPLERMVHNLELAGDVVSDELPSEDELAARLRSAAAKLDRDLAAGRFDA